MKSLIFFAVLGLCTPCFAGRTVNYRTPNIGGYIYVPVPVPVQRTRSYRPLHDTSMTPYFARRPISTSPANKPGPISTRSRVIYVNRGRNIRRSPAPSPVMIYNPYVK